MGYWGSSKKRTKLHMRSIYIDLYLEFILVKNAVHGSTHNVKSEIWIQEAVHSENAAQPKLKI